MFSCTLTEQNSKAYFNCIIHLMFPMGNYIKLKKLNSFIEMAV